MKQIPQWLALLLLISTVSAQAAQPGDVWKEPKTGMEFVWMPKGCFQMGSNDGQDDEKPVHQVCVDGFWMGKYEVTQAQYQKLMSVNPSEGKKAPNHPVESVSWHNAKDFADEMSYVADGNYQLPTEAQWEYACRAGGQHQTNCGGGSASGNGWYKDNSGRSSHPVGQKRANAWGLYDMSGNVWEWVSDWYDSGYYAKSPKNNPQGPTSGERRGLRGGSWDSTTEYLRAAVRYDGLPANRYFSLGFRLTRSR